MSGAHGLQELYGIPAQRLSLLPVGVDVDNLTIAPDSKAIAFIGTSANKTNVYLYSIDPLLPSPVPRQMTATGGNKECLQFAAFPMST